MVTDFAPLSAGVETREKLARACYFLLRYVRQRIDQHKLTTRDFIRWHKLSQVFLIFCDSAWSQIFKLIISTMIIFRYWRAQKKTSAQCFGGCGWGVGLSDCGDWH